MGLPHIMRFTSFFILSEFENINNVHLLGLKFNLYSSAYDSQIFIRFLKAVHEGDKRTMSSAFSYLSD